MDAARGLAAILRDTRRRRKSATCARSSDEGAAGGTFCKKQQQEGNSAMAYETIKYEVEDQILTITLNRPDKLNAFNATMQQELIDAFDQADRDDNVRAIIVTGAGRGFRA